MDIACPSGATDNKHHPRILGSWARAASSASCRAPMIGCSSISSAPAAFAGACQRPSCGCHRSSKNAFAASVAGFTSARGVAGAAAGETAAGHLLLGVPVRIEALEMSLHTAPGAGGRNTPVGWAVELAAFGAEARIIPKAHSLEFGGLVRRSERFSDRSGPLRRDRVTGPIGASRAAIPEEA